MELKTYSCPNCGASVPANPELKNVSCNQCGTSFAVEQSFMESVFGVVNKMVDNSKEEKAEKNKQFTMFMIIWLIFMFLIICSGTFIMYLWWR